MSCLQNCGDCTCVETDVCLETETKHEEYNKKLKVLKDYACLIAQTTCVNLAKRVGQYAYFVWCYLRDILNLIINLEKRVDNLCSVVKCHEKKLEDIYNYLMGEVANNISFSMSSSGSTGGDGNTATYTALHTSDDGSFTIYWNMVNGSVEIGQGAIHGKVNHSYSVNSDGSINANISSFTLNDAVYTLSGGYFDHHSATFTIYDNGGSVVYQRNYDPNQAWSESINTTVTIGSSHVLSPNGGTSGHIPILSTLDTWLTDPTVGYITASYTNNNKPVTINNTPCNIQCGACENK